MDNRPQLLTIPSFPSLLQYSSSHSSPLSPLTPPPRLHLRTLLPSPPISPFLAKAPPPVPYPWIWRCHICHSVYQLGVTRRCLEDGHYFCSLPTPPASPTSPSSTPPTPPSPNTHPFPVPPKKKRRRKPPRGCRAEFDYSGWEAYNLWRRETSLLKGQQRRQQQRTPSTPLKTAKDCYRDCDFPSECQTFQTSSSETIISLKRKSEPELIFPLSPTEILRLEEEAASDKEDEQLLFDIAATTPPCTSSTHRPRSVGVGVARTGHERRKSFEAEKRGLEHEALFVISPITALVDPEVVPKLGGWDFNMSLVEGRGPNFSLGSSRSDGNLMQLKGVVKGKERESDITSPSSTYFTKSSAAQEPREPEEETEEDEQLIVREFIRVKKKKSIAKIEQLTGLKMSEVQYGRMVGEEVAMDFDVPVGDGIGEATSSWSRRGSVELDSPPSSPLKMFYTITDSDSEGEGEGESGEGEERGYGVGYGGHEVDDELTWDEVKYGVR
ncbi:hypothetical protein ACMFMG_002646 [Clarireedia jacksonii]